MTAAAPPPEVAALRDLHRVVMLVNSEESLADVLQTAAEGVVEALHFRGAAVNLLTARGDYEVVTVVGPGRDLLLGTRGTKAEWEAELSVADHWGELRFVPKGRFRNDASTVVWMSEEPALDVPDAWDPEDALFAPLRGPDGTTLGILSLDLPADGRRPSALKCQVLELYAVQIGLAISHARERERLRRGVRLATATSTIVQTAGQSLELAQVLESSLDPLVRGFEADRAWIRLFADAQGAWTSASFPHDPLVPPTSTENQERGYLAAAELAARCWEEHRTVVVTRAGQDDSDGLLSEPVRAGILAWLDAVGSAQYVMVPVGAAQRCLGFFVLARPSGEDWTEEEADAALEIGRELGRVIDRARVREREIELYRRLEELDLRKSEMITTVVHELKNPLTSIRGHLELVQEDPDLAERAHEAIAFNLDRVLGLVQNMLALSELKDLDGEKEDAEVDLSAVVRGVEELLGVQYRRAEVELDLSGVADGVTLRGNSEQLERMVLNLISNAIKFSDPGSRVLLGLRSDSHEVEFTCADRGLGITEDEQQHLFEEFRRSTDPAARSRPGTGLGLSIVARIVDHHGGRIEVESVHGQGSTFRVRLPVG